MAGVGVNPESAIRLRSDMEDSAEELARWPQLHDALRACQDTLLPAYRKADEAALRHQRWHRWLTMAAAIFGTLTVLAAILQLSRLVNPRWPLGVEIGAALFAACAVLFGVMSLRQKQWLLQRHKAEQCRLLKFRFLSDPEVWQQPAGRLHERIGQLRREVEAVECLYPNSLHHGAVADLIPELPQALASQRRIDQPPQDLLEYYQQKRLEVQMAYFSRQAERNVRLDHCTRLLPPGLFFVSVAFAFLHFLYDVLVTHDPQSPDHHASISVLLIVAAIAIPVLGAGVRTWRTAYEFARNAILFRAKYTALGQLAERLRRANDPTAVFYAMWCCEQILDSEHREWLRLMIEAEWFG
jgi:hypothetical protein